MILLEEEKEVNARLLTPALVEPFLSFRKLIRNEDQHNSINCVIHTNWVDATKEVGDSWMESMSNNEGLSTYFISINAENVFITVMVRAYLTRDLAYVVIPNHRVDIYHSDSYEVLGVEERYEPSDLIIHADVNLYYIRTICGSDGVFYDIFALNDKENVINVSNYIEESGDLDFSFIEDESISKFSLHNMNLQIEYHKENLMNLVENEADPEVISNNPFSTSYFDFRTITEGDPDDI